MRKTSGNILMVSAVLILIYIYYPYFTAYLPVKNQLQASDTQAIITIPKINAQAKIIANVDPANEIQYKAALEQGVAQAKGFASPGDNGLVYIFAHSSLAPWDMTRVNTPFLRLGELNNGDQIIIDEYGKEIKYQVTGKEEFWPNQTQIFNQEWGKNELILQTCTPMGTDLKRLLIFARPVN